MGSGKIKRPRPETETKSCSIQSGYALEVSTDSSVPTGDVDEQITFNETRMREIIGVPIETDDVSVSTSHNTSDLDGEAPARATASNVEDGTTDMDTPTPADGNDGRAERPEISNAGIGGKVGIATETSVRTASTEPLAPIGDSETSEPSEQTALQAYTEPRETPVPTPQTGIIVTNGDTRTTDDTAPANSTSDSDSARRTVKQRKSDLDEYRRRYMTIPRIKDRKPVFVSKDVRDKLDRIVRLLGERGMSVSGLIENIALHHLAIHEPDIEHWRKM